MRKLWHTARRAGHPWGRDQVGRLMAIAGIDGVRRGRHRTVTTRRDQTAPRHPDLCDRAWASPTRPDQWWVADFTYGWTLAGFVYVSFVSDVYSRRILGWRVSRSKTTPLVSSALEQALFTRRRGNTAFTATGLLHHSDAGSHTSRSRPPTLTPEAPPAASARQSPVLYGNVVGTLPRERGPQLSAVRTRAGGTCHRRRSSPGCAHRPGRCRSLWREPIPTTPGDPHVRPDVPPGRCADEYQRRR